MLAPGGLILLAERVVAAKARGHAAHGLTSEQVADLAGVLAAAGFTDVRSEVRRAGRRTSPPCAGTADESTSPPRPEP